MSDAKPHGGSEVPWTYDHYVLIPDDGRRHEIIGGEHHVTASPVLAHQRILGRLYVALVAAADEAESGEVLLSSTDVLFSHTDIVVPDLLYVSNERAAIKTEKNIQGAPDLVIEILSPSTRRNDERLKRDLYKRVGVREYWIVDPELESVKIYTWDDDPEAKARILARENDGRVTSRLLPCLELSLDSLFEKL